MKYTKTTPCEKCPFRSDITPFISPERAEEIALDDGVFPCHETVDYSGDDDEARITDKSVHCAGKLIMREKMEDATQMMRVGERLGLYDRTKLNMQAPVFDDVDAMVDVHMEEAVGERG